MMTEDQVELMIIKINEHQTRVLLDYGKEHYVCKAECATNRSELKDKFVWPLAVKVGAFATLSAPVIGLIAFAVRKAVWG